MKVNVLGWYSRSNVGDEAFKPAFEKMLEGHDFRFVTPPEICDADADLIVLGGGAVVSPYYLGSIPEGVPRVAFGVDLGYESESRLVGSFSGMHVRHKADLERLRETVSGPVEVIPDLAYFLQPSGRDILSRYTRKTEGDRVLGVLLTDYVNPAIDRPMKVFRHRADDFVSKISTRLKWAQKKGWKVVMIPCSTGGYGNDIRINLDVASYMEHLPVQVMDTLSPQDTVDLIAQCDLTICMKFHAHIFSIIAGTPFLSIPFARKVHLLLKEDRLKDMDCGRFYKNNFKRCPTCSSDIEMEVENFDCSAFEVAFNNVVERSKSIGDEFRKRSQARNARLRQVMQEVREDWTARFG